MIRLLLYLIVVGLGICVYTVPAGYDGFMTSIVDGSATKNWLSTQSSYASNGTVGHGDIWLLPDYLSTYKYYYYTVNETEYKGSNYDVHGAKFVGTQESIDAYRYQGPSVTVYYNPEDPSESVLKQGISFDPQTVIYIVFTLFGLAMASIGAIGLLIRRWRRKKLAERESADSI